jgi:hypothetical protein
MRVILVFGISYLDAGSCILDTGYWIPWCLGKSGYDYTLFTWSSQLLNCWMVPAVMNKLGQVLNQIDQVDHPAGNCTLQRYPPTCVLLNRRYIESPPLCQGRAPLMVTIIEHVEGEKEGKRLGSFLMVLG